MFKKFIRNKVLDSLIKEYNRDLELYETRLSTMMLPKKEIKEINDCIFKTRYKRNSLIEIKNNI